MKKKWICLIMSAVLSLAQLPGFLPGAPATAMAAGMKSSEKGTADMGTGTEAAAEEDVAAGAAAEKSAAEETAPEESAPEESASEKENPQGLTSGVSAVSGRTGPGNDGGRSAVSRRGNGAGPRRGTAAGDRRRRDGPGKSGSGHQFSQRGADGSIHGNDPVREGCP